MADEDECMAVVFAYWYIQNNDKRERERKKKRKRRFWIHDVIRRREELGEYHRLVQELRCDADRFRRYLELGAPL